MSQPIAHSRRRRPTGLLLAILVLQATIAPRSSGQSSEAATRPATRPAFPELERLNFECVSLFERMQGSVLRVQMPTPRWNNDVANDARFQKWNLNSEVRQSLQQRATRGNYDADSANRAGPATSPGSNPGSNSGSNVGSNSGSASQSTVGAPPGGVPGGAGDNTLQNKGQQGYTIIVPPQQAMEQQPQQQAVSNVAVANKQPFAANSLGLLLNDHHVLVPVYVEREAVGEQPIKLACGDGEPIYARFVGSDQQTQLTVLQLNAPAHAKSKAEAKNGANAADAFACLGKPVILSDKPLPEGSVVLMLSPIDGAARLAVWSSGARDLGVVLTIDGQVAGIARHGQFLSGGACKLIADQIVRHGAVRRATLGVIISQVDANDPARQNADLGDRPAVRIDQVMKDSVAERGGLVKGDLILTLAGDPVHNIPTLAAAIAARQGLTELKVLRDGKVISMRVDLVQK
ncbi:S1C family serine protease [Humisphaera borealis]|uniref:Serine protease n=1 Tax=Humisphaera borealis TaxID=2807512 RepID=A0A7M2WTI4_9BACT|nr:S1C family serine protease [Humisphaera borealis]QOV88835.1 serine protease [Humisphaera borealis]